MNHVTTYVGMDARKKDLFVAMVMGKEKTPVTLPLANEPKLPRLVRKLERQSRRRVQVRPAHVTTRCNDR